MGELFEVRIHGLGVSGEGVGRLPDGRVVFVPHGLPGDRVRVQLGPTRKRVQYADLLALLEPSSDRVQARCTKASCSGCVLASLSPEAQARLKQQRILETLWRVGGVDLANLLGAVEYLPDGWLSRHRARFHVQIKDGRYAVGFFEQRSRRLVDVQACPILWPELEQTLLELRSRLNALPLEARLEEVEIAFSRRDGRAALRLAGGGSILAYRRWLLDLRESPLGGVLAVTPEHTWRHGNVDLRYDHGRSSEFDLRFEPGVFTQQNPTMNDRLVAAVVRAVHTGNEGRVLELHAGIGNFSIPLRLAGVDLVASEQSGRAAVLCRRNARAAGAELEVLKESDELAARQQGFSTVLLDPPRTGAKQAVELLAATPTVRRVVYVSCDAATLARDTATLAHAGFSVTLAQAFDLFPNTPHVETLLVLER